MHFVLFRAVITQVKRTFISLEAARSDCPLGTVSIDAHIAHANPWPSGIVVFVFTYSVDDVTGG